MTAEDWKRAEQALNLFHPIQLKADGYDITLVLEPVSGTESWSISAGNSGANG